MGEGAKGEAVCPRTRERGRVNMNQIRKTHAEKTASHAGYFNCGWDSSDFFFSELPVLLTGKTATTTTTTTLN